MRKVPCTFLRHPINHFRCRDPYNSAQEIFDQHDHQDSQIPTLFSLSDIKLEKKKKQCRRFIYDIHTHCIIHRSMTIGGFKSRYLAKFTVKTLSQFHKTYGWFHEHRKYFKVTCFHKVVRAGSKASNRVSQVKRLNSFFCKTKFSRLHKTPCKVLWIREDFWCNPDLKRR